MLHSDLVQETFFSFMANEITKSSLNRSQLRRPHMPSAKLSLTLAAATMIMAIVPADASPRSYQLICKGGGAMVATIKSNATISLSFSPGSEAGVAQAGKCTWVDRGFRAGEPNVLSLAGDRNGTAYLLDGMLSGDRFYVHVYNDNNGRMVVTRTGL
jgi:hypothetical protein